MTFRAFATTSATCVFPFDRFKDPRGSETQCPQYYIYDDDQQWCFYSRIGDFGMIFDNSHWAAVMKCIGPFFRPTIWRCRAHDNIFGKTILVFDSSKCPTDQWQRDLESFLGVMWKFPFATCSSSSHRHSTNWTLWFVGHQIGDIIIIATRICPFENSRLYFIESRMPRE